MWFCQSLITFTSVLLLPVFYSVIGLTPLTISFHHGPSFDQTKYCNMCAIFSVFFLLFWWNLRRKCECSLRQLVLHKTRGRTHIMHFLFLRSISKSFVVFSEQNTPTMLKDTCNINVQLLHKTYSAFRLPIYEYWLNPLSKTSVIPIHHMTI